jgi:flagellar biosynthesis chaperone FliJ
MAKFVFRLEPLLTVRRRAEDDARREVAVIQRERLDLEAELRRRQQDIVAGKDRLRGTLTGRLDLGVLRLGAGSTLNVMRQAQQLALKLAGLGKRMESVRHDFLQARIRRRAIELLRERRFDQWKAALGKAETAALDEMAVSAAARRETEP